VLDDAAFSGAAGALAAELAGPPDVRECVASLDALRG
jgi:hypothetical protein